VIDPHFVTFFSSLYTTIRNPNSNPNRSRIVIIDSQRGFIRKLSPFRSAVLRILSRAVGLYSQRPHIYIYGSDGSIVPEDSAMQAARIRRPKGAVLKYFHSEAEAYIIASFYPHYAARKRGTTCYGNVAGWVGVCYTPVLCLNG